MVVWWYLPPLFNLISIESLCKKTARTLISPHVQWRLIYVCTVFHVPQIDGHAYMGFSEPYTLQVRLPSKTDYILTVNQI